MINTAQDFGGGTKQSATEEKGSPERGRCLCDEQCCFVFFRMNEGSGGVFHFIHHAAHFSVLSPPKYSVLVLFDLFISKSIEG